MQMVECCCSLHLLLMLEDGGHAGSQTEGETVTGNSRFLDCRSGGKCLPGQLDMQSSAVPRREGFTRQLLEEGSYKAQVTSDLLGVK